MACDAGVSVICINFWGITYVIALRLYRKKGDKVASIFLVVTIAVILFAILILWRLLGEG